MYKLRIVIYSDSHSVDLLQDVNTRNPVILIAQQFQHVVHIQHELMQCLMLLHVGTSRNEVADKQAKLSSTTQED